MFDAFEMELGWDATTPNDSTKLVRNHGIPNPVYDTNVEHFFKPTTFVEKSVQQQKKT